MSDGKGLKSQDDGRNVTMGHDDLKMVTVTEENRNFYCICFLISKESIKN